MPLEYPYNTPIIPLSLALQGGGGGECSGEELLSAIYDRNFIAVTRCRSKSVFASTESDVVGVCDYCPCVVLCDLATCHSWRAPGFSA